MDKKSIEAYDKIKQDINEYQREAYEREAKEIYEKLHKQMGLLKADMTNIGIVMFEMFKDDALRLIDLNKSTMETLTEAQKFLDSLKDNDK